MTTYHLAFQPSNCICKQPVPLPVCFSSNPKICYRNMFISVIWEKIQTKEKVLWKRRKHCLSETPFLHQHIPNLTGNIGLDSIQSLKPLNTIAILITILFCRLPHIAQSKLHYPLRCHDNNVGITTQVSWIYPSQRMMRKLDFWDSLQTIKAISSMIEP